MSVLSPWRTLPPDAFDGRADPQSYTEEVNHILQQQSFDWLQVQNGSDPHVLPEIDLTATAPSYHASMSGDNRIVEQPPSPRFDTTSLPLTSNKQLQIQSNSTAIGIITKTTPYVRPSHPKILCQYCDERPEGFRGTHELDRHIVRAHSSRKKAYICIDASPDKTFLTSCTHCRNQKVYGAYYNAAAHLRRAHFHPRKRGRKGKSEEKRGGIGGGDHPAMDHLKQFWIKQVEVENNLPSLSASESDELPEPTDASYDSVSAIDAHASYLSPAAIDNNVAQHGRIRDSDMDRLENDEAAGESADTIMGPEPEALGDFLEELLDQRSSSVSRGFDIQHWNDLTEMSSASNAHARDMDKNATLNAADNLAPPTNEQVAAVLNHLQRLQSASRLLSHQRLPAPNEESSSFIIGHLTVNGAFTCNSANCQNISFRRYADFRRHYEHNHVAKRVEYYCNVDGCNRSRKPLGRTKGRSFGTREDKMREHIRTVHEAGLRTEREWTITYSEGATEVARGYW